jgi:hypothetical protein
MADAVTLSPRARPPNSYGTWAIGTKEISIKKSTA